MYLAEPRVPADRSQPYEGSLQDVPTALDPNRYILEEQVSVLYTAA